MLNKPVDSTIADKVELAIGELESLSTLPSVISQCLGELLGNQVSVERLTEIIESDPAAAIKILSLANPSGGNISIRQAIEKLSTDEILQAILGITLFQQSDEVNWGSVLLHINAVAWCAKQISQVISPRMDSNLAYMAGLLHDIGKIAIGSAMPKSFERIAEHARAEKVNSMAVEQEHLGIDHTIIGKRLCQKWSMPNQIVMAVWLHHSDTIGIAASVPEARLAQIVQLADSLVRSHGIGDCGSYDQVGSIEKMTAGLSITHQQRQQIEAGLDEMVKTKRKILGLDSANPKADYDNAMNKMAAKLASDNAKFSQQRRRLGKASGHFEFTRELFSDISSQGQVIDIAEKIAKTWQEFYQTGKVCLWLKEQGVARSVKAAIAEGNGKSKTAILSVPEDGDIVPRQIAEKFDVLKGNQACGWVFDQLQSDFDLANTKIIPLLKDSKAVGALAFEFRYPMSDEDIKDNFAEIAGMTSTILEMAMACQGQQRLAEKFVYLTKPAETVTETKQAIEMPVEFKETENVEPAAGVKELESADLIETVSEIAAGAAHELNNPLLVISGRAQLLSETETDEHRKQSLIQIKKNASALSGIIDGLMSYAKPQQPRASEIAVSTLIEESVNFASQKMGMERLDVQIDIEAETNVFVDSAQIVSAIANIICNAVESYEGKGGAVEIKASIDSDKNLVNIHIIDHGCGMDEVTLKKAKQPFFSAKPAGRKRGMGLAYADRYIQLNGGKLDIASEVGRGTTVTIGLPR